MSEGRYLPLSAPRLWVGDLVALGRRMPLVSFARTMNVAALGDARRAAGVGWCTLFIKAMGMVSQRHPMLRRAFLNWPWPRLYEHGSSAAMVAIERPWQGESSVFFGRIAEPENLSLAEIGAALDRLKTAPVEKIREYRRLFRATRLVRPLRRFAWACAHGVNGPMRVKCFGTFGVSVTASSGATAVTMLSPATTTLHYGMLRPNGDLDVCLTFDHRVMDGLPLARAMAEMEETLNCELLRELQGMTELRRAG